MSNCSKEQIQNLYKYVFKGIRNFNNFFFSYLHKPIDKTFYVHVQMSRLKIKIPQKYPLTLRQVVATDLSVRFGCVRYSQKHNKSPLLLITNGFVRDIGNMYHGHNFFFAGGVKGIGSNWLR
jgi:hypothetical protein